MKYRRWLASFTIIAVLILVPALALAQSGGEAIANFDSKITVSTENVATITETITYNFGYSARHGIKRFVPIETRASEGNKFYYYEFEFIDAKQDGRKVEVDINSDGAYKVMRLGDPDKTINGLHVYTITYKLWPVVEHGEPGDYLNWNITGNDWEVPIEKAKATITFEQDVKILDSRCYTGVAGSTYQFCAINNGVNSLNVSTENLLAGEGLTINSLLTPNSYATYLAPSDPPPIDWRPIIGFAVGLLAVAAGLLKRFYALMRHLYRRSQETVIAKYEPPNGLSPGEVGYLTDNKASLVEISATLIDLAVRGYIKIEQTQPKRWFKKAEYTFHLLKKAEKLLKFETNLLNLLFRGGAKSIELKNINKTTASTTIINVKEQFKKALETKGYYVKEKPKWFKWTPKRLVMALLILGVIASNIPTLLQGRSTNFSIFSIVAATSGLVIGWLISRRVELTPDGYSGWAEVEGLKLFLSVTEKDRLKFHDAPDKNPKLFNKFLPYAIALGVEKQWAKQFESIDITNETGWYSSSYGNFNAGLLAGSLSSDFSSAVASNIAPTQSSGGYGGGGFSGGGGGGGGGGSW